MRRIATRRPAFTLVEMLVVVSIIGILMALLLPAMSGVKSRGRKARELSNLRQVGVAWNLYAGANEDAAIPSYLDPERTGATVQNVFEHWNVKYKFPTKEDIPPEIAAPWTWRLIPYLGAGAEIFLGHLDLEDQTIQGMVTRAELVAQAPAFGYNGFYTGGWWEVQAINMGDITVPRYSNVPNPVNEEMNLPLVAQYLGSIERQSDYIVFCSSTNRGPGILKDATGSTRGSFLVTPPYLDTRRQWEAYRGQGGAFAERGDQYRIEAFQPETYTPIGRHTLMAAIMYADGHVDSQLPGSLEDPRLWINHADEKRFGTGEREFMHEPDNPW